MTLHSVMEQGGSHRRAKELQNLFRLFEYGGVRGMERMISGRHLLLVFRNSFFQILFLMTFGRASYQDACSIVESEFPDLFQPFMVFARFPMTYLLFLHSSKF